MLMCVYAPVLSYVHVALKQQLPKLGLCKSVLVFYIQNFAFSFYDCFLAVCPKCAATELTVPVKPG